MTIRTISETRKASIQSIQIQIRRKYGSCTFGLDEKLPYTIDDLYGKSSKKRAKTKIVKTRKITEPKKTPVISISKKWLPSELDVINYVEMGLISLGLWRLYGIPGAVLSVMMCLFIWKAQKIAKDPELRQSGEDSLNVVGLICFITFFLHFMTFWNATGDMNYSLDKDTQETYIFWIHIFVSLFPAMFISILSFRAVRTTHKIAVDNDTTKRRAIQRRHREV